MVVGNSTDLLVDTYRPVFTPTESTRHTRMRRITSTSEQQQIHPFSGAQISQQLRSSMHCDKFLWMWERVTSGNWFAVLNGVWCYEGYLWSFQERELMEMENEASFWSPSQSLQVSFCRIRTRLRCNLAEEPFISTCKRVPKLCHSKFCLSHVMRAFQGVSVCETALTVPDNDMILDFYCFREDLAFVEYRVWIWAT